MGDKVLYARFVTLLLYAVAAAVERSLKADLRCSQLMAQAQALQLDFAASQAERQKADSLLADIVGQIDAAGTGLVLAGDGDCSDPAVRLRALIQTVQRSRMEATAGAVGLEAWLESAEGLVLALEGHHAQLSLAAHNALQQMLARSEIHAGQQLYQIMMNNKITVMTPAS